MLPSLPSVFSPSAEPARRFFSATRILRGVLEAPKPDRQVYITKVNDLAAKYAALVQRTTTTTAAR